jgi:hypothetical protein
MNENAAPRFSGRMLWGLIVLALGVLWTLDNLGQIDASRVVQWWPLVALLWGVMLLGGMTGRPRRTAGWIWTIIGALSLLRPLGIANADVTDFWPVLLIVLGGGLVWRAWTGRDLIAPGGMSGPRLDASAFLAGSQRKIVTDEFSSADVNAVIAGTTLDFRPSRMVGGKGVVDVFAMWGGIDLIVPPEWRVVSEVTPILGVFSDVTVVPADAAAPTLTIRGTVVMGGIEVRNDERKAFRTRVRGKDQVVQMGPGGIVRVGVITGERSPEPGSSEKP